MSRPIIAALFALAAAIPSTGHGEASYTIAIRGEVPVMCRATMSSAAVPVTDGAAVLGTLHEFCNSARGYRVYADPSPGLAGATLVVDGARKRVGNGAVLIAQSDRAGIVDRTLSLEDVTGDEASISLRIEAI